MYTNIKKFPLNVLIDDFISFIEYIVVFPIIILSFSSFVSLNNSFGVGYFCIRSVDKINIFVL